MERKPVPVPILPPSCLTNMAINHEDISQFLTLSQLRPVTDWMESRTAQQSENIVRRNDEKTRGNKIRLLVHFLGSKPFWEENFHKLQCFVCEFSQEVKKNCYKPIRPLRDGQNAQQKSSTTRTTGALATCMTGPWTRASRLMNTRRK
jgi:hypothetical protein